MLAIKRLWGILIGGLQDPGEDQSYLREMDKWGCSKALAREILKVGSRAKVARQDPGGFRLPRSPPS